MTLVFVTRIVGRLIAVVQVALGLLFWTGHAASFVNVHIAVGLLLVVDLWIAIVLGVHAGAPIGLAAAALVWSIGMPIFGLVQTNLLTGSAHPIVQVLHLIVGLAAVGLIEGLAASARRRATARP